MVQYHKSKTFYIVQTGSHTAEALTDYCARQGLNYLAIRKRFTANNLRQDGFFYIIQPNDPLLINEIYRVKHDRVVTEFGQKVVKAVLTAGSRPKLACILGVNRSTIRNWIYNESRPTDMNKILIEKYLEESEKYNGRFSFKLIKSDRNSRESK